MEEESKIYIKRFGGIGTGLSLRVTLRPPTKEEMERRIYTISKNGVVVTIEPYEDKKPIQVGRIFAAAKKEKNEIRNKSSGGAADNMQLLQDWIRLSAELGSQVFTETQNTGAGIIPRQVPGSGNNIIFSGWYRDIFDHNDYACNLSEVIAILETDLGFTDKAKEEVVETAKKAHVGEAVLVDGPGQPCRTPQNICVVEAINAEQKKDEYFTLPTVEELHKILNPVLNLGGKRPDRTEAAVAACERLGDEVHTGDKGPDYSGRQMRPNVLKRILWPSVQEAIGEKYERYRKDNKKVTEEVHNAFVKEVNETLAGLVGDIQQAAQANAGHAPDSKAPAMAP